MTSPPTPSSLLAIAAAMLLSVQALTANAAERAGPAPAAATKPVVPPAAPGAGAAVAPTDEDLSGEVSVTVEVPPSDTTRGLDEDIQGLKKQIIDLNRDLFVLEEELLFPANTQVAVFVSMDVGEFFALDSIVVKIDNKEVSNYLYTAREEAALVKGGAQRLYVGNLKAGQHELVALFTGKGPNQRDYRRGASLKFEKGLGAKYLELKITDRARRAQPEFEIKDWE